MSSHHFVTESQTMALFIAGPNIDGEALTQLLEWNPMVLVGESQLERMLSMDVRVDILIADNSGSACDLPYSYSVWKDNELAGRLEDAVKNKTLAGIVVAGPLERKVQETLIPYEDWKVPVVCHTSGRKHYLVKKGNVLRKWMAAGSRFQLEDDQAIAAGNTKSDEDSHMVLSSGIIQISPERTTLFTEFV